MRETTVLDFSLIDQFRGIKSSFLLASINGIVHLQCSNNSKFLLNPITAELLTLPLILPPSVGSVNLCGPSQSYVFFVHQQFSHKLGVSVTGVHKVAQIHTQTGVMAPPSVHLYTLGVGIGEWRRLQPPPLGHYRVACANDVSFDGDIYWILQGGHRVLKFTVDTKSFELIDGTMGYDKRVARVGVLNGKLCVILAGLDSYLVTVLDGCVWSKYASCELEYGFVPTLTITHGLNEDEWLLVDGVKQLLVGSNHSPIRPLHNNAPFPLSLYAFAFEPSFNNIIICRTYSRLKKSVASYRS